MRLSTPRCRLQGGPGVRRPSNANPGRANSRPITQKPPTRRHTALGPAAPDTHAPNQTPARPLHPASGEADAHPPAPLQTAADPRGVGGAQRIPAGLFTGLGGGGRVGPGAGGLGRRSRPAPDTQTRRPPLQVRRSPVHTPNISMRTSVSHASPLHTRLIVFTNAFTLARRHTYLHTPDAHVRLQFVTLHAQTLTVHI